MERKQLFEQAFAAYCGTSFAIAVNSGTTALDLCIDALDLEPGGVVVASSYGHPSTIRQACKRHRLLLVDVSAATLCLSAEATSAALESGLPVRCVITTHFAGQPGNVEHLAAVCRRAGVPLIEDASHAHGARVNGRSSGSFGDFGAFSLHATKNLAVYEGGVITCSDEALFRRVWRDHDIGRDAAAKPYDFVALGGNHRMGEATALMARHRLMQLEAQNARRAAGYAKLRAMLPAGSALELLPVEPGVEVHALHLVAARYRPEACSNLSRGRFVLALSAEGIACNAGWPCLLSEIAPVRPFCEAVDTPVAARAVTESVWLDQRLLLEEDGPQQIVDAILKIQSLSWQLRRGR